jgi:hypothetical protein
MPSCPLAAAIVAQAAGYCNDGDRKMGRAARILT